jgi:hypothetical protein
MAGSRDEFERRVLNALEATPSRIPVVLGGCGTGRTMLLNRLYERDARGSAQYIDIERCATTPERFLQAVTSASQFAWHGAGATPATAREAFDMLLAYFDTARAPGGQPCTFLLDEVLELRTFESFPGLRHVIRELVEAISGSANRFVFTTRYTARALRLLRDASPRFDLIHVPALSVNDVIDALRPAFDDFEQMPTDERFHLGETVQALTDGRGVYVRLLANHMSAMGPGPDPVGALTALLAPDGELSHWCRFRYELRLHRARGYGALKAILDVLADEEQLTLTAISHRLHRTPGSTKDYLSWLEDVDLVASRQKRYAFSDPLMRLWVRLNGKSVPPTSESVLNEVHQYALTRVPRREPAVALAYAGVEASLEERKNWGIIEID